MKIIIAEDETFVRATILSALPYHQMDLEVVAEASNGDEALLLCREYKPDVLITDIKMPGLSGLELIEAIHQTLPDIQFIIISGYDSFEYAKTAMKLGVRHYLSKPADEGEMYSALSDIAETIVNRIQNKRQHEKLAHQIEKLMPANIGQYLNSLILKDRVEDAHFFAEMNQSVIHFQYPFFSVLVFYKTGNALLKETTFSTASAGYIAYMTASQTKEGALIGIVNHTFSQSQWQEKFIEIQTTIEFRLGLSAQSYYVGVSLTANAISHVQNLYLQAARAACNYFIRYNQKVFFFTRLEYDEFKDFTKRQKVAVQALSDIIKVNNIEGNLAFLDTLFSDFIYSGLSISPALIKDFFFLILSEIISTLDLGYITLLKEANIRESLYNSETLQQLKSNFQSCLEIISENFQKRTIKASPVMGVKAMLDQNPENDYTLEQIASYAGYNATHFSELFKNEVGMGFSEYKKTVKMHYAKKLIETTGLKMYEISERLGYGDPKYFMKLYKSFFGQSPNQYRKKTTFLPKK